MATRGIRKCTSNDCGGTFRPLYVNRDLGAAGTWGASKENQRSPLTKSTLFLAANIRDNLEFYLEHGEWLFGSHLFSVGDPFHHIRSRE